MTDLGGRLTDVLHVVKGEPVQPPTPTPTPPGAVGTAVGANAGATGSVGAAVSGVSQEVIAAAKSALGKPYVWGGNSLDTGVDCSGLVQQAYKAAGITLPRISNDQARAGTAVSYDEAQPGDILWWDYGVGSQVAGADHVAIYLGNGQMIEALHRGAPVHIVEVRKPDGVTRITGSSDIQSTTKQVEVGPNDSLGARLAAVSAAMSVGSSISQGLS